MWGRGNPNCWTPNPSSQFLFLHCYVLRLSEWFPYKVNCSMFSKLKYNIPWHCTSMELPCKKQQRLTPVNETRVYLTNQHNVMTKGCDTHEGTYRVTSWIYSPCVSLLSSYTRSGASTIWLCFPGSHWPHGLRTYPLFESPPETPSWLVMISQNDSFSSCFLSVWSQGHSSWVSAHHAHSPATLS